jgi:anion-transporting  ArsA/GET3 family ATPase
MDCASLDKRFLVVAGKGGVGKSTVASALGLRAARAGRRTVIAELGARSSVPSLFGLERSSYEPIQIEENLFTLHIEPDPALREYALRKLKFETLFNLVFENDGVRRFLDVIPGMHELLLLGKAFDLEREESGGSPAWDSVIIDAPATGHGVSLLRLPQVILEVIEQGPMADEARRMRALLEDEQRTAMVIVTLLEEMPIRETVELYETATKTLQMPVGPVIANRVWPSDLSPDEAARWLACDPPDDLEPEFTSQLEALASSVRRGTWQRAHLEKLQRSISSDPLLLPELPRGTFNRASILVLAQRIEEAFIPDPSPSSRSAP